MSSPMKSFAAILRLASRHPEYAVAFADEMDRAADRIKVTDEQNVAVNQKAGEIAGDALALAYPEAEKEIKAIDGVGEILMLLAIRETLINAAERQKQAQDRANKAEFN